MDINNEMIKISLSEIVYEKKEGTATSYYYKLGDRILPNRASIQNIEITKVARKGRNLQHPLAGQFIGQFTKKEQSPLKLHPPFVVRTQIWRNENYPIFIGYGTIGISDADGNVTDKSDIGDLVLFYSDDADWQAIKVFYFKGFGRNPDYIEAAYKYASRLVNE
jgi:hypothetical protein